MSPQDYMKKALEEAIKAQDSDEVPVGAIVVDSKTGEIVGSAHNLTEHTGDCTCHAEILAIREACAKTKNNRLRDMDIYVTLEPCAMCAAAISFARIRNLYFGALDKKNGAVVNGIKFYDNETCHHKPFVFSGIMENETSEIMKKFFKTKRKQKIVDKTF